MSTGRATRTDPILDRAVAAQMGPHVLGWLAAHSPLPARGIVAGQAVTSALLALYGTDGRRGPLNDIDIFVVETDSARRALPMGFAPSVRMVFPGTAKHFEVDGAEFYLQASRNARAYDITRVERDGLLNVVAIRNSAVGGTTPMNVLATFDLNCVCAAIDIESRTLHWTRGFEEFARTGMLEISHVQGDGHSAWRILKKLREMPWMGCDFERAMGIITTALRLREAADIDYRNRCHINAPGGVVARRLDAVAQLGPVYKARLDSVAERIAPWMKVVAAPPAYNGSPLWSVTATDAQADLGIPELDGIQRLAAGLRARRLLTLELASLLHALPGVAYGRQILANSASASSALIRSIVPVERRLCASMVSVAAGPAALLNTDSMPTAALEALVRRVVGAPAWSGGVRHVHLSRVTDAAASIAPQDAPSVQRKLGVSPGVLADPSVQTAVLELAADQYSAVEVLRVMPAFDVGAQAPGANGEVSRPLALTRLVAAVRIDEPEQVQLAIDALARSDDVSTLRDVVTIAAAKASAVRVWEWLAGSDPSRVRLHDPVHTDALADAPLHLPVEIECAHDRVICPVFVAATGDQGVHGDLLAQMLRDEPGLVRAQILRLGIARYAGCTPTGFRPVRPIEVALNANSWRAVATLLAAHRAIGEAMSPDELACAVSEPHIRRRFEAADGLASVRDPDRPCQDGVRPIMVAVAADDPEAIALLARAGASLDAVSPRACLPPGHLLGGWAHVPPARHEAPIAPLMAAAQHSRLAVMETLIGAGARLDAVDGEGNTALHHAAVRGARSAVEFLLARNADHRAVNAAGARPIDVVGTDLLAALSGAPVDQVRVILHAREARDLLRERLGSL